MKKRSLVSVFCILMVLALILSGCSQSKSASSSGEGTEDDMVKIGYIGPLTGDVAVAGIAASNTAKMFFDDLNKKGGLLGKQVELVVYDTKSDATEAVNAVKRLASQDKVVAILGPNGSGQAIPIASVLEEFKIPCISDIATNPKVTVIDGKVKPYVFRACFIDPYQGAVAASFSYDVLNVKNAAILYDVSDDYAQGLTQFFEESYIKKGGKIVAKEAFKTGDVDFRAQLTRIKAANPDIIFMPCFYKDDAMAAKQARELGMKTTFIGGDAWPSQELLNLAGDAVEGTYIVNHMDLDAPTVKEFKDAYMEKYGKQCETNGFLLYDACLMLVDAVERANSFDGEKIKGALETCDIQGITGHIKIGKDTHNPENKDAAILKVVDGAYKFQQLYSPKQ